MSATTITPRPALLAALTLGALLGGDGSTVRRGRKAKKGSKAKKARRIRREIAARKDAVAVEVDPKFLNRGERERRGIFRGTRQPEVLKMDAPAHGAPSRNDLIVAKAIHRGPTVRRV